MLDLAYRTGEAWNESAFSNAEALSIAYAEKCPEIMKRLEEIMQEQGVMIQPYWRALYRHAAPNVRGIDMHPTVEHHHYKWWLA